MIFQLIRVALWLILLFGLIYFAWKADWTNALLCYIGLELKDINTFQGNGHE